ncbi:MAG TPA: hypothetical protein GX707_20550 [Epulopiscium sp.]|nr:hypothetical protein [Candidatus Epulonipiscium sp.]
MAPFDVLLQVREELINFYKKYEKILMPLLKFIMTVSVLLLISDTIGYAKPLTKTTIILMMGLMGVFLSPQLIMLLFILLTSLHVGAGSLEVGLIVFIFLLIIYLLFVRLYPLESLFIVGMIIAYKFHIPYIIPLIAGLFSSLAAIVAVTIGATIWYSAPQFVTMMESQSAEIADIVGVINTNITTLQAVFKSDQTLLASIIILSAVLLTVYIIRKQNIDFAEYIAILVGVVMNLVGFLFAIILLRVEVGIAGLMISTIMCGIIAVVVQFFAKIADYSRTETVQFEDEKNYYYVKVVPKIIAQKSKRQIKRNYTK